MEYNSEGATKVENTGRKKTKVRLIKKRKSPYQINICLVVVYKVSTFLLTIYDIVKRTIR